MPVTSIALFGSMARGDHDSQSDTDLLMITTEEAPRHSIDGKLSLSFYPFENLLSRAHSGDLFLCHILYEGKELYDPNAEFQRLRSEFHLRSSYKDEIDKASDLGWFICDFGESLSKPELVNRRIAWCVRTILISKSAETGTPVFSASALAEFAGSGSILPLIKRKTQHQIDVGKINDFRSFLLQFASDRPLPDQRHYGSYANKFRKTSNYIGLGLLRFSEFAGGYD